MSWAYRFMLVPDAQVAVARLLVKTIAPTPSADGMWTTALNATGAGAPTHWVSNGMIQDNFAAILGNATMTFGAYQQAGGLTITLAQIQDLYAAATIIGPTRTVNLTPPGGGAAVPMTVNTDPQQVLAEMGLKLTAR